MNKPAAKQSSSRSRPQTSTSQKVEFPSKEELLKRAERWQTSLLDGPVTFFPIRHHSPACAAHLEKWIENFRPDSVIIEGPRSFNQWIPALTSGDCAAPVAILTTYREEQSLRSPGQSAFYPFCDYSPEWIALQKGRTYGAKVSFTDLEFADKIRVQQMAAFDDSDKEHLLIGVSLTDDPHLRHSLFIQKLTRRLGCRDFDELWDHIFESRSSALPTESFVGLLAAYCDLSRQSYDCDHLIADGTLAREAVMIDTIRAELKRLKKPTRKGAILVVTGGFHTVALLDGLAQTGNPHTVKLEPLDESKTGSWLIRYHYQQLDSLGGYRSGMPHPGFYDALWQAGDSAEGKRLGIAKLLTTIARKTRGQSIQHEASVTDTIAALEMLDRLADIRGHHFPTRYDLLDVIGSCMRKESSNGQDQLSQIVRQILAGDRLGTVPASVGHPPIIQDFLDRATKYRLPVGTIEPRNINLELYRKPAHRETSFFLHQMEILNVPYAVMNDGPDFINRYRLSKLREEWSVNWCPETEGRLAELSISGESVAKATLFRIMQFIGELEEEGEARNASGAIDLLIRACRCGLHNESSRIVEVAQNHIVEDANFGSIAIGASRLDLLYSACEPLEADEIEELPNLIKLCYERAVFLVSSLNNVPDDQVDECLNGLLAIRELLINSLLANQEDQKRATIRLNSELYYSAIYEMLLESNNNPRSEIAGAVIGILYTAGRVEETEVCEIVWRYLNAIVEDIDAASGVLRGLMMSARESFWQMKQLLKRLDTLFKDWEEERFQSALPHMRLAFSQLSPVEVDRVAKQVAKMHETDDLGPLTHPDVTEEEMLLTQAATAIMNNSLKEDGLK